MCSRVAKIDQRAVAHVIRDKAIEPGDDYGDGAMIRGDDLAQILGIEPRRERGRADQIAEHNRELPPFGSWHSRNLLRCSIDIAAQRGDRSKQLPMISDEAYAKVLQVVGS
jgi:hypothetical protein